MLLGSLGSIPFIVARGYVRTFQDFSRSGQGRWARHDLIGRKPVMEYLGPDLEKLSFKIQLRADHGMDPRRETQRLRTLRDRGSALTLIVGGQPVGENDWIIENISENTTFFDPFGIPLSVTLDISLSEAPEYSDAEGSEA